jgi:pyruvate/2-oxoglutarate dehydrogenase complex dihydrolipoamide dehydrogenase (E3) component
VTLIQRSPQVLKEHSSEVADVVERALRDEGMDVFTGTKLEEVAAIAGGVRVVFTHNGERRMCEAAELFNALGRRPNTDTLGLAAAGVALNPSGHVVTDEFQRTSNPAVYAAGDCAGPHEIVHVAILQGELAARHACGQTATPVNYGHLVKVVFTDPQVATAGLSARELLAQKIDFITASYPFDDHGKSIVMEAKRGYVRIFARRNDGRLLGAECIGRDASELIHAPAVALALNATVADLLRAHWYHPTLSEIWTYPLEECAIAVAG